MPCEAGPTHQRPAPAEISHCFSVFIAADAVDAIVKHYVRLLSRERADRTDQCPRCASRNVRTFFDIAIESDGAYFEACAECGWDSHPGYPSENDDEHSGDPVR
jgi:hypothetical protein